MFLRPFSLLAGPHRALVATLCPELLLQRAL
jgi:hypothetical protein